MRGHGGLLNRLLEDAAMPGPEVGMGATELLHSDRSAYTVVEVLGPRRVAVRRDRAVLESGSLESESQRYRFEPDPEGRRVELTRRADGRWWARGERMGRGHGWLLGRRLEYRDPTF